MPIYSNRISASGWLAVVLAVATSTMLTAQESRTQNQDGADTVTDFDSLRTEVIDVTKVIKRLRDEMGIENSEASRWVEDRARQVLQSSEQLAGAASDGRPDGWIGVETSTGSVELQLDRGEQGQHVEGSELVVAGDREAIRRVKELMSTLAQFGLRQVVIKTHVLRDSEEAMRKLPIRWSHIEAASRVAQVPEQAVSTAAFSFSKPLTGAAQVAQKQSPATAALLPPPGVTSATWTEASSIVERATPVLYTLLSPDETSRVLASVKQISTIERVMTPTVVVFNGQVASISDSVQRPFVTGIRPVLIGEGEMKQVEFSPSIKVVHEGTTMKIRPELTSGKSIRLSYELDLCKIRSVEKLDLPGPDNRQGFSVQMPEVASTQFRTCIDMPVNYTLAISAFETDDQGNKQSIVVLCHCSLRDVDTNRPK